MKNLGTNLLWYRQSAYSWNEALPLGNGRMGAMVYGDPLNERICLNEDTLWSGKPDFCANPTAEAAYKEARKLVLEGRYSEAQRLMERDFTGTFSQLYMPLGDLHLRSRASLKLSIMASAVLIIAGGLCGCGGFFHWASYPHLRM